MQRQRSWRQFSQRERIAWSRRWLHPQLDAEGRMAVSQHDLDEEIRRGRSPFCEPTASNVRLMIRMLGGRTAWDRRLAIEHLRDMGERAAAVEPAVIPALIRTLRCEGLADGEDWVGGWVWSGCALSDMGRAAVPEILSTIQREWREDRNVDMGWRATENALTQAIGALARIGAREGCAEDVDTTPRVSAQTTSQISVQLCRVLGSLLQQEREQEEAQTGRRELMREWRIRVRRSSVNIELVIATVQAIGEFGGPDSVNLLEGALRSWGNERSLEGTVQDNVTRALLRMAARRR